MTGIKRILVPTDFSASSEDAVAYAEWLGKKLKARVRYLHVIQVMTAYLEGPSMAESFARVYEEQERQAYAAFRGMAPKARREDTVVRRGVPVLEIVKEADRFGADMVVMGTHGRTGLDRLMLGSVAQDVVRKAPCPVLVVKSPSRPGRRA